MPCIEGNWAPNHTFLPWDLVLPFCLLLLGRALPFLPFLSLWPNNLSEATSSCPGTNCLTSCLHQAMEYLVLPLQVLMLQLHCWWVLVGLVVRASTSAFGVASLNLLFGVTLFLFLVASPFLTLGFVSGSGSLYWLAGAGIIDPILFSTSRKVFIFLIMFGCGWRLGVHSMHLTSCVIWSVLKMCVPCIDVTLTSMSTTSTSSLHLKYPCRKLHSDLSKHAI